MPPVAAVAVSAFTAAKGAVMAAGIMKSMAVAGTALSVVGAATKNPKLTKIGAIVGGVGALGSMGAFGAGAKTWGMSGAAKQTAMQAATPSLARQAVGSTVAAPSATPTLATRTSGLLQQAIGSPVPPPAAAPTGLLAKTGAALSKGAQMIKGNPEVAKILAAGGAELANYLSGKTDAEIRALESQIDVNDANAQQTLFALEQEKRRRQTLNQGYLQVNPVISLPGQTNPYQPPGLLAQNMAGAKV
jgi:hypothetical protein